MPNLVINGGNCRRLAGLALKLENVKQLITTGMVNHTQGSGAWHCFYGHLFAIVITFFLQSEK
jgi:hypothetical protein